MKLIQIIKKKKVILWSIGIFSFCLFLFPLTTYASATYGRATEYVEKTSLFSDVFRMAIWWIVKMVHFLSTFFEEAMWKIFDLPLNFFNHALLNKISEEVRLISLAFLVVVILLLGLQIWKQGKIEPLKRFSLNLMIFMAIVLMSNTLMNYASNITNGAVDLLSSNESISSETILNNLYDIGYMVEHQSGNHGIDSSKFKVEYFDLTTKLDRKKYDKFVFYDQESQSWKEEKLNDGLAFTGFGKEYVYRYHLKEPFIIIVQLLVLTFGFILSSLKFARLILELGFKKILLWFVGVLDLNSGNRFKRLIMDIGTTFIMIGMVAILFRCYVIANHWISEQISDDIYVQLIFRIAATLMLLDGPKIVETLFGMDAGISKDGLQATHYVTSLSNTAGKVGEKISSIKPKMKQTGEAISNLNQKAQSGLNKFLNTSGYEYDSPLISSPTEATETVGERSQPLNEVERMKSSSPTEATETMGERSQPLNEVEGMKPSSPTQATEVMGERSQPLNGVEGMKPSSPTQATEVMGEQSQSLNGVNGASMSSIGETTYPNGYKPSIREVAQTSMIGRQMATTMSQVNSKVQNVQQKANGFVQTTKHKAINKGLDMVKEGMDFADQMALPIIHKMSQNSALNPATNEMNIPVPPIVQSQSDKYSFSQSTLTKPFEETNVISPIPIQEDSNSQKNNN